jgi:hypothetical protein
MRDAKRFVFFPRKDIFAISLPKSLGGFNHRKTLERLSRFEGVGPKFLQIDMEQGKWPEGIEIKDYHRRKRSFDYILTNRWGWNARDTSLQYVTEFYQVLRWLRFQKALATVREHIVGQLNCFFLTENIEVKIALEGIPTQSDIESCSLRLVAGDVGFKDVYEALRL